MSGGDARRPLASRNTGWARGLAGWLAARGVAPNSVSAASVGFAVLAGVALWGGLQAEGAARVALLLLAALAVQGRLLCNLLDGMIAVEGGRGAPDGAFWNEAPDRLADIVILVGLGLGAGWAAAGWAAATLAVLTAYLRAFGQSCGLPADFRGPMAKPQRMALVTLVAVLAAVEPLWGGTSAVATAGLGLLIAGTALTACRRALAIRAGLRG